MQPASATASVSTGLGPTFPWPSMVSVEFPVVASNCRSWVHVRDAVVIGPAMMTPAEPMWVQTACTTVRTLR